MNKSLNSIFVSKVTASDQTGRFCSSTPRHATSTTFLVTPPSCLMSASHMATPDRDREEIQSTLKLINDAFYRQIFAFVRNTLQVNLQSNKHFQYQFYAPQSPERLSMARKTVSDKCQCLMTPSPRSDPGPDTGATHHNSWARGPGVNISLIEVIAVNLLFTPPSPRLASPTRKYDVSSGQYKPVCFALFHH